MLGESRIDDEFFTYRVTSEFPGELILEPILLVWVFRVEDSIAMGLDFTMIMLDGCQDADVSGWRGRGVGKGTQWWTDIAVREGQGTGSGCRHSECITEQ